jgi:hypothetical protein
MSIVLDRRHRAGAAEASDPVVAALAGTWANLGAAGGPPTRSAVVGLDRSDDAKVVSLLFDAAGTLVAAAKVARSRSGEQALVAERDALRAVGCTHSAGLAGTAPRALALFRAAGRLTLVQTPASGRPMSVDYYSVGHVSDPSAVAVDLAAAGDWLALLHRGTWGGRITVAEASRRWLLPALESYRRDVADDRPERALFTAARTRVEAHAAATVPVTAVHGDFWMGNVLRERPRRVSAVVDWERSRVAGVPLVVVFKFPTSYGLYLDRAEPWRRGRLPAHRGRDDVARLWAPHGDAANLVGFGYTYFGTGWFPALVRSFVTDQVRRLGVPSEVVGPFFVGFLAEQALAANTEDFRAGCRTILRAFAAEHEASWLWQS